MTTGHQSLEDGAPATTRQIRIRALQDDDVSTVLAACDDWRELAAYGPPYWRPRSAAEVRRRVASTAGPALGSEYSFVISGPDSLIGECSVHAIDYRSGVAQLGVCIWNSDDRGRGYGRASVEYLVDWAFNHLGLQRLEAWIVDGNEPSLGLFRAMGFEHEGTFRRRYLCAGVRKDMHVLAYLAQQ